MPAQIAIVHGWSDTSKSFRALRDFLRANGFQATQIWLGDYVSTDDDVRIEDVGKRMERVIRQAIQDGKLTVPFDLIVHSTGGLLAREWITRYYPDGKGCPVKRLIMLAPANFGSALASLGKSMIGRVAKGWNNWFQTGTEMLVGLELASAYQWDLARRDLLDPVGNAEGPYGPDKVWPFVIVGSRGYDSRLRQIVNEHGADGAVRCAAANLNAVGITIDFATDPDKPGIRPWHWRSGRMQFPFAVLPDRDHSSIHEPAQASSAPQFTDRLGQVILQALACESSQQYGALHTAWQKVTASTAALLTNPGELKNAFQSKPPEPEELHQYMQIVTLVRDDEGQPVNDYFLEFFPPDRGGDAEAVYFHKEVLEHVHVNSRDASRRCLFVDHTDLMQGYYPRIGPKAKRQVAVSLSAAKLGENVRYFDSTKVGAKGHLVVHHEDEDRREELGSARLRRHTTHLVEITIPRQPIDKVFKLSE